MASLVIRTQKELGAEKQALSDEYLRLDRDYFRLLARLRWLALLGHVPTWAALVYLLCQ